jgi:hypothetical protein
VIKEFDSPTDVVNPELYINLCWNSLRVFPDMKCFADSIQLYDHIVGDIVRLVPEDRKVSFDEDLITGLNSIIKNQNILPPKLSQIIYKFPMLCGLYKQRVTLMLETYNLIFTKSPDYFTEDRNGVNLDTVSLSTKNDVSNM